ncbi:MAG: hypothetical protein ACXVH3_22845 [Solirubrobacteraceae bacterium]
MSWCSENEAEWRSRPLAVKGSVGGCRRLEAAEGRVSHSVPLHSERTRIVTALLELGADVIISDELVLLRRVFDERALEP